MYIDAPVWYLTILGLSVAVSFLCGMSYGKRKLRNKIADVIGNMPYMGGVAGAEDCVDEGDDEPWSNDPDFWKNI